jgi:hypothetical protein
MKDLLSSPIDILAWVSDEVNHLFEKIKRQLPEVLQIKLCPAGHLSFFLAKVEKAHRRLEAHHSQASLTPILLRGSMKKSQEQITLNYSQALPESHGRDSFKGGRFVTPTFYK